MEYLARRDSERLAAAQTCGYLTVRYQAACVCVPTDRAVSSAWYCWGVEHQWPYARILTRPTRGIAYLEVDAITLPEYTPASSISYGEWHRRREDAAARAREIVESYPLAAARARPRHKGALSSMALGRYGGMLTPARCR